MKTKINIFLMILTVCSLFSVVCLAGVEGELQVAIPGHDAKITFQEIDENSILVSATDSENDPVKGLTKDNFVLKKGTKKAIITSTEVLKTRKNVGINYVLVLDNSLSMKQRKAIKPLLSALDEFLKIVRPLDNIEVVTFDGKKKFKMDGHDLRINTFKSNNHATLKEFFQNSFKEKLSSETFLYEGIAGGLHLISSMPEKSNKFLVIFTDGEDLNSEIETEAIDAKAEGLTNFNAYAIDFMPSKEKNKYLKDFAQKNGGKVWKATSAKNLLPIFKKVSTTLLHQYVVEYNFLNPPKGSITVSPTAVTIEELTIIDSSPLLSYIFFDAGKSELPGHYKLLKSQAEAKSFDGTTLRNTMEKYYNVLNIIGKRFSENQDASIELVGCISNRGEEKNNIALSQARAEEVRAYLRYIWGIDSDRIKVTARKLPAIPSTNSAEEGVVENQRVEIHTDSSEVLDSIKSTYIFKVATSNEIKIQPKIKIGYDLKDWDIEIKGNGQLLKSVKGQGNDIPAYSFNLVDYGLDTIGTLDDISVSATMTDVTGESFTTKSANTSIQYIKRVEREAEKLEYRVVEKYSLILFDYNSSEIKERNKTVLDRVVQRIRELPEATVTIVGHSDIIGKEDYNVLLSLRRAKAVYDDVIESNVSSPERIVFRGDGPYYPPYDNSTAEGRSFNRTVIITIEYETN